MVLMGNQTFICVHTQLFLQFSDSVRQALQCFGREESNELILTQGCSNLGSPSPTSGTIVGFLIRYFDIGKVKVNKV
jgi:hypothetical protein